MSEENQVAFARYLNLTVGYVSQLKRGVKQPSGPALVLLDLSAVKAWRRFYRGYQFNAPARLLRGEEFGNGYYVTVIPAGWHTRWRRASMRAMA